MRLEMFKPPDLEPTPPIDHEQHEVSSVKLKKNGSLAMG